MMLARRTRRLREEREKRERSTWPTCLLEYKAAVSFSLLPSRYPHPARSATLPYHSASCQQLGEGRRRRAGRIAENGSVLCHGSCSYLSLLRRHFREPQPLSPRPQTSRVGASALSSLTSHPTQTPAPAPPTAVYTRLPLSSPTPRASLARPASPP